MPLFVTSHFVGIAVSILDPRWTNCNISHISRNNLFLSW